MTTKSGVSGVIGVVFIRRAETVSDSSRRSAETYPRNPQNPTRTLTVSSIERALDGLLRAILDHERRQREAQVRPRIFEFLSIADLKAECLPTRAESHILELGRDPIGTACREGIRRCGEALFRLAGVETMGDVIERVAELDPASYGSRGAIMDANWNGVGGSWWS